MVTPGTITTHVGPSPRSQALGDLWFDTISGQVLRYDGTQWQKADIQVEETEKPVELYNDGDYQIIETAGMFQVIREGSMRFHTSRSIAQCHTFINQDRTYRQSGGKIKPAMPADYGNW